MIFFHSSLMTPLELDDEKWTKFQQWANGKTCLRLTKESAPEVVLLRNRLSNTWYRQNRTVKYNRYGEAICSVGLHDKAFHLATGHLRSELDMYYQCGYHLDDATNPMRNNNPKPKSTNQAVRSTVGRTGGRGGGRGRWRGK